MGQLEVIEAKLNAKQEELQHYEALLRRQWAHSDIFYKTKTNAAQLVGVLEKIQFRELDAILSEGLKNPEIIKVKRKALHRHAESMIKRATFIAKCSQSQLQSQQQNIQPQSLKPLKSPQHIKLQAPQHTEQPPKSYNTEQSSGASDEESSMSEQSSDYKEESDSSSELNDEIFSESDDTQAQDSNAKTKAQDSNDKPFPWINQMNLQGLGRRRRKPLRRMQPFYHPFFDIY